MLTSILILTLGVQIGAIVMAVVITSKRKRNDPIIVREIEEERRQSFGTADADIADILAHTIREFGERQLEHDRAIGQRAGHREVVHGTHRLDAERPHRALVDERAVDEAIGHHVRAACEGRRDDLLDRLFSHAAKSTDADE